MLSDEIIHLKKEIELDLELVSKNLDDKYVKYIPLLRSSFNDAGNQLEELSKKVNTRIEMAGKCMEDSNESLNTTSKQVKKEYARMVNWRESIDNLCLIENNFMALLNLGGYSDFIRQADLLLDSQSLISQLSHSQENDGISLEKIRNCLNAKLLLESNTCRNMLFSLFDQFITVKEGEPLQGSVKLTVSCSSDLDPPTCSQILTAMYKLNFLEHRMKKIVNAILRNFCHSIIHNKTACDIINSSQGKYASVTFNITESSDKTKQPEMDVKSIFSELTSFFVTLQTAISLVSVDLEPLSLYIGKLVQEDLMSMIFKECICAVVSLADQNEGKFSEVMTLAEQFREKMVDLGIWNDRVPLFAKYAEQHERIFVDRRCLAALTAAKQLICKPIVHLVEVGYDQESGSEDIDIFAEDFGVSLNLKAGDQSYPQLYRLLRCEVSDTVVEYMALIEKTLRDAVETDNEVLAGRLALTARNMIRLYLMVAPKYHMNITSSVPQAAAVFYNNSYYICHRLLLLPLTVLKGTSKQETFGYFHSLLSDTVFPIRSMAAEIFENMLANCRRQISTLLVNRQLFVNLDSLHALKECQRTLRACVSSLKSTSEVWIKVLSETVYCKAMGNVASFLLQDLCSMILAYEDIRSPDAEMGAKELTSVLEGLESLFMFRGFTHIHSFCSSDYFRTKEIVFCLNGSLQSIADRWCDSKGPLSEWMSSAEVRSLIKAIFMNTEQRKQLLDSM